MRMLARLVLALVVLLSVPMAASACHVAPASGAPAAHAGDHHRPEQPRAAVNDLCIGCIAPATLHPPVLAERIDAPRLPARDLRPVVGIGATARPATPPPRLG
jgi:hypothetical protein